MQHQDKFIKGGEYGQNMLEQPFQQKGLITFLDGQKIQVSFEYKTQDSSTKTLTNTFSIEEINKEENSVKLKIERAYK